MKMQAKIETSSIAGYVSMHGYRMFLRVPKSYVVVRIEPVKQKKKKMYKIVNISYPSV